MFQIINYKNPQRRFISPSWFGNKLSAFGGLCFMNRPNNFIDYTGQRLGKLLLLEYVGKNKWKCLCDCGYSFEINSQSLRKQNQRRCKYCFYKDKTVHGGSGTPEYQAWKHIKERCYDENDIMFLNYGGRGIEMCQRWVCDNGFINFLNDVGKRPSKNHSIDRINVNGNYEPENCRWATRVEQNNNKTNTIYIEHNGERNNLSGWSKKTNISTNVLRDRYHRKWDYSKILTTPLRKRKFK